MTELYRQRWLDENLPAWLPNILLRYRLNNEMWQALSMRFEQIELDHWQGKPLPPSRWGYCHSLRRQAERHSLSRDKPQLRTKPRF